MTETVLNLTPVQHPTPSANEGGSLARVAAAQGGFYFATGVWPLIHMESFEFVTGPKVDRWLVYTVGVLIIVIGMTLMLASRNGRVFREIAFLGIGSATVLAAIDVVFVTREIISPVYLGDAIVEGIFVLWWVGKFLQSRFRDKTIPQRN